MEAKLPWTWRESSSGQSIWQPHPGATTNFVFGDGHAAGMSRDAFEDMPANSGDLKRFLSYPF